MNKRKKIIAWLQNCPYPELVTPETAKLAQKAGLPLSSETLFSLLNLYTIDGYFPDFNKAGLFEVTQVNIQKWLREEKFIHIKIGIGEETGWSYTLLTLNGNFLYGMRGYPWQDSGFASYEEALEKGMYVILKKYCEDQEKKKKKKI